MKNVIVAYQLAPQLEWYTNTPIPLEINQANKPLISKAGNFLESISGTIPKYFSLFRI